MADDPKVAAGEALAAVGTPPGDEWRCFHCDEIFTERACALEHFGTDEGKTPACRLSSTDVVQLRKLEHENAQLRRDNDRLDNFARLWHEAEADRERRIGRLQWWQELDNRDGERLVLQERIAELEASAVSLTQAAVGTPPDKCANCGQGEYVPTLTCWRCGDSKSQPLSAVSLPALQAEHVRLRAERDELRDLLDDKVPGIEARIDLRVELEKAETKLAALQAEKTGFCEAHQPPHRECACCEAVHQAEHLTALRAALQTLRDKMRTFARTKMTWEETRQKTAREAVGGFAEDLDTLLAVPPAQMEKLPDISGNIPERAPARRETP